MKLNKKALQNIALVSQIGISMITPIIICILLGNYLDKKFNTNLIFLVIFITIGVGSAFTSVYKLVSKDFDEKRK
nr:AtpZ/AtpI family protein [Gottschalkia acidurici]